jgi:hypothetical protein
VPGRLFRFVQLEVPWALGPADGRYVVRRHAGEEPDHILVLGTLGAPRRGLLSGRRESSAAPEPPPTPVTTGRATVIPAVPFEDADEAARWLSGADRDAEVAGALDVLGFALHAHRVASADPFAREVARDHALVVRIGFGEGEQVAEGRWAEAVELPVGKPAKRRGEAALRPQERLAAVLGGRDAALACETLVLRARADFDAGREREAALQLRVALEAALAELAAWRDRGDLNKRLGELAEERGAVGAAANAALQGGLDPQQSEDIARVLGRLEAALRARSAAGFI